MSKNNHWGFKVATAIYGIGAITCIVLAFYDGASPALALAMTNTVMAVLCGFIGWVL